MVSYMTAQASSDTNAQILSAATRIFAKEGYAGARVDEIATAAGVNKATLYYRIGDKAALYGTVITQVLQRIADQLERELATLDDAETQLRCYVHTIADNTDAMQEFAPIMLREIASGGRDLPDDALEQMMRIMGSLQRILAKGAAEGVFRASDLFLTHMMVIGSVLLYAAGGPIRARAAGRGHQAMASHTGNHVAPVCSQLADMILAALQQPNSTTSR